MLLKPKLHKESINGFKTINCRHYPVLIFSKNCFSAEKIVKNSSFFSHVTFFILKIRCFRYIKGYCSYKTYDFQKKKVTCEKMNSFQHFVNISTNSKSPAIKFFIRCFRYIKGYCGYKTYDGM
jgi:hypothetical protein